MSTPADVPHLRPAGSSPQFRVTFGAGFGSPSPVIGLGTFTALGCANAAASETASVYVINWKTAPIANAASTGFSVDMALLVIESRVDRTHDAGFSSEEVPTVSFEVEEHGDATVGLLARR